MDTTPVRFAATLEEQARVRDRAVRDGLALRRKAIDAFWVGAADSTVSVAARAAERLAARLRQHAKRRAAAAGRGLVEI